AGDSAAVGETLDAGKESSGSRPTSADLSRISRGRRRGPDYDFHHLYGAAIERVSHANRGRAPIGDTRINGHPPCRRNLLVARRTDLGRRKRWLPRVRAQRRRTPHMGPFSIENSRLRPCRATSLLRPILAHARHTDSEWDSSAPRTG